VPVLVFKNEGVKNMMNWLVVVGHPLVDSLCCSLSELVSENLKEKGHEVVVKNLYDENFNPSLTSAERENYYSNPYDYSSVERDTKQLLDADGIILLFPTWWFGFPAILKGWIDRVWVPGIAYDHVGDLGPIKPRLKRLRNVIVITTLGAPWWIDFFIMRRPVKKIVKYAILGACSRGSKLNYFSLYKCENLSANKLDKFKRKICRCINRL